MTEFEEKLLGGLAFSVTAPLPNLVETLDYYDKPNYGYYVFVMPNTSLDRLVFQIWDLEDETKMEIDGCNTFIFNISPHSNSLEEDDEEKGYDFRPSERYGSVDEEMCEMYDDSELYLAIKLIAFSLVESIKKQNV